MKIRSFVIVFLILSTIIGSVGLIGDVWKEPDIKLADSDPAPSNENYPGNAFVKREQSATEFAVAQDNLTYRLAESLAVKMQEYNPDGPGDINDPGIWRPNTDMVMEEFLAKKEIYGPVVLDQASALARRTKAEQVNIIENASPEEIASYLQVFAQIAQEDVFNDRTQRLTLSPASPETISAIATAIDQSIIRLDELSVPREHLSAHISFRDVLIDLERMLGASIVGTDDPVRTILALDNQKNMLEESLSRFNKEMAGIELKYADPEKIGLLRSALGIKTANAFCIYALCFTFDFANLGVQASKMGKDIASWARKWATETLKDVLVHRLVQQTIGWIQGNGKPKFVTNWKSFLGDVANQAAGDFLYRINPKLCSSFGPMIRVALTPVTTAPDKGITCTLDQVMSNVQSFYDNFSSGGWIAYGATLQPSNNFLGAYFQASDMMMIEKAEKTQAKESEAKSSSGFLGTKMCVKWEYRTSANSNVNVTASTCPASGLNPDGTLCTTRSITGSMTAPKQEKICVEEKTTTPGDMVAKALGDIPGAPLQRIVNAQDITALVNALVNAAMSKLVSSAKNIGADSDGDPGVLGISGSSGDGSSYGPFCAGLAGSTYSECVKGVQQTCTQLPPEETDNCLKGIVEEDPNAFDPKPPKIGVGNSINPPPPMDTVGFNNVIWIDRDVSGFAETARLQSSFSNNIDTIYLNYNKAGVWPVEKLSQVDYEVVGNAWIFVYRRSNWYAATFDWLGPNQDHKGTKNLTSADDSLPGELVNFQLKYGENYYVMVSTPVGEGHQPTVEERSDVVEVVMPVAPL